MFRLLMLLAVAGVGMALDSRTIMTYLTTRSEFSTLVTLLRSTHLDSVLEAQESISTLFAPTDQAFGRLPPDIMAQITGDPQMLQKVLMSHILNSAFISLFMANDQQEPSLSGIDLRFNIYNRTYTVNGAAIREGDVVLRNGVLHVIDEVILPPEGSVLRQVLVDDEEFEDLTAAMAVINILEELEGNPITVFAPNNAAFQAYYQNSLPNDLTEVRDMLENHIVNGTFYLQGLQDGVTLTSLSGHPLRMSRTGTGDLLVNDIQTDGHIFATNGVIYVMKSVLGPTRL